MNFDGCRVPLLIPGLYVAQDPIQLLALGGRTLASRGRASSFRRRLVHLGRHNWASNGGQNTVADEDELSEPEPALCGRAGDAVQS